MMPSSPDKLFVEGYLSPGVPIQLSLIRSSSLRESLSVQLVWNAKAELVLADTAVVLQNILYRGKESIRLINYVNTYRLPTELSGDSLRLRIVTEGGGDTLYAATPLVEQVRIDGWELKEKMISVSCPNSAKEDGRYYGVYLEYELEGEVKRKSEYYDYSSVQDKQLTFQLDVPSGKRAYRLILYRITAANYSFQRTLQQASRASVDPFEPPVALPTNVQGGQGIFTYITADTLYIK
ncbi:DUF4249 family protein [Pontibacter actiniarum]|nr:DUF4249 family protein [Pontibacter actiniarum]